MELRREDFPITLQAYNVHGADEEFVAEQVVNTQAEANNFMSMYAGKLIKTRDIRRNEVHARDIEDRRNFRRRTRTATPVWAIVLVILVVLLIVAYATGWLQTMLSQIK